MDDFGCVNYQKKKLDLGLKNNKIESEDRQ